MLLKKILRLLYVAMVVILLSMSANIASAEIIYDEPANIIFVNNMVTNISTIYSQIHNESIIAKNADMTYLLHADLIINENAVLNINSSDVKWLKISSTDDSIHYIFNYGIMNIDSVEISSWNSDLDAPAELTWWDNYASQTSNRSYIVAAWGQSSHATITNSEIHHLGMGYSWIDYPTPYYSLDRINESTILYDHPMIDFGITFWNSNGNLVQNNIIYNNKYGISFINNSNNNRVIGNTIYGCIGDSILFKHYCNNGIISDNNCTNIKIENQNGYPTIKHVIELQYHNSEFTIENNTVNGGYHGIYLQGSNSYNNILNNFVSTSYTGIRLYSGSNYNLVQGNNVDKCTMYRGIEVRIANHNIINDNIITNTIASGAGNGDGIYTDYGSTNTTISNNDITSNEGHGIAMYSRDLIDRWIYSENNQIYGNIINNNGQDGIYLWNTHYDQITNNLVINNGGYGVNRDDTVDTELSLNVIIDNTLGNIYPQEEYVYTNVSGYVRSSDLSIISGATVSNDITPQIVTTDSNGEYTMILPFGVGVTIDATYNEIYSDEIYLDTLSTNISNANFTLGRVDVISEDHDNEFVAVVFTGLSFVGLYFANRFRRR